MYMCICGGGEGYIIRRDAKKNGFKIRPYVLVMSYVMYVNVLFKVLFCK